MGKIFKGQSALRITINTYANLEAITEAVIKYKKPDGKTGEFPAGVSNATKGIIFHECIENEIDLSGWWALWAYITFVDGRTASGEVSKVYVYEAGR